MAVPHFILVPYDIDTCKIILGFTNAGLVGCFAHSERIDLWIFTVKLL